MSPFHIKDWLTQTLIINTTILTLCHSNMFQPSRAIFREYNIYFSQATSTKWVTRCKIQFRVLLVLKYYCPTQNYLIHFHKKIALIQQVIFFNIIYMNVTLQNLGNLYSFCFSDSFQEVHMHIDFLTRHFVIVLNVFTRLCASDN